eukprot:maker-scaffold_6-snap-gene-4.18-mRNA-1 protein AED:0.04 eAED:0.30 QI:0/0/0.5/1/1/1/2/130/261
MTTETNEISDRENETSSNSESISFIEQERQKILDGTHPELVNYKKELEASKERALRDARTQKRIRNEEAEKIYSYQLKSAEEQKENQCKQRMLHLLEGVKSADAQKTGTRNLRSKNLDLVEPFEMDKKAKVSKPVKLSYNLSEEQILSDLSAIEGTISQESTKKTASENENVKLENQDVTVEVYRGSGRKRHKLIPVLRYKGKKINVGTAVVATTHVTGENLLGEISSVRTTEVEMRLADGTRARVPYEHIRSGRVKLKFI